MAYTFCSSVASVTEVHGTRRESASLGSWTASVQLRCPWSSRYTAMDDLTIRWYQNPWPYGSGIYPTSVQISAELGQYTQSGQGMDYEFALLDVDYGIPGQGNDMPSPSDPNELYSETIEPSSDFLKLDHKRFQWGTGAAAQSKDLTPDEAPGRQVKGMRFVRTIYQVAFIPTNILDVYDTCNDRAYYSRILGITFDVETLLLGAPKISRTVTSLGAEAWNVQLWWEHKPQGWNTFYRHSSNDYEDIYYRGTSTRYTPVPIVDQRPFLPG